jgi:hypothetical protein
MPELKTSIFHFTKLNKDDNSQWLIDLGFYQQKKNPLSWQITVIYHLVGYFYLK